MPSHQPWLWLWPSVELGPRVRRAPRLNPWLFIRFLPEPLGIMAWNGFAGKGVPFELEGYPIDVVDQGVTPPLCAIEATSFSSYSRTHCFSRL